jgi:hypothetical protein
MALEALTRIGQLYHIEQRGKALSIGARQQLRVEQSQPVLNALQQWLIQTRANTANGGGSAKALDYTLKRWPALIRYAKTGHLPIDNNPVENTIRPLPWVKRTGYSPVPSGLVNGPQPSKRCWALPNSTELIRQHGLEIHWKNCPPGLTVVSTSYCLLHIRSRTLKHRARIMGSW